MRSLRHFERTAREIGFESLTDVASISYSDFYARVHRNLNEPDAQKLYKAAHASAADNTCRSIRIISRNAPELQGARHLALIQSSDERHDYQTMFGGQPGKFTQPGSVASMFSPAAYLTELYREARGLHAEGSNWNLNARRPDLKDLTLSQANMGDELSTLSLSNEILLSKAIDLDVGANRKDRDGLISMFSYYWLSGRTPYHEAFHSLKLSLAHKPTALGLLKELAPDDAARRIVAALATGINPNLYAILTEAITYDNHELLCERYLGDQTGSSYAQGQTLARYFEIKQNLLLEYANRREYGPEELLVCAKAIRLHLETGLSIAEIKTLKPVTRDTSGTISLSSQLNEDDINMLFIFQDLRKRYGLCLEDALILGGRPLARESPISGEKSQFERLFTGPDGELYQFDDYDINCEFGKNGKADAPEHERQKRILKQLLQTDDYGLLTMVNLAFGKSSFKNNLDSLTRLYAFHLLRKMHVLSVEELRLSVILWKKNDQDPNFLETANLLHSTSIWLEEQNLDYADLFSMLTRTYPEKHASYMEALLQGLRLTLAEHKELFIEWNEPDSPAKLYKIIAPDIASGLELDSIDAAEKILAWYDALRDEGEASCFCIAWNIVKNTHEMPIVKERTRFFYRIGQLSFISRKLALNASELALATAVSASQPKTPEREAIKTTFDNLILLSQFFQILSRSGKKAPDVVDSFINKRLSIQQFAEAIGIAPESLTLAAEQFISGCDKSTIITDLGSLELMLKWHRAAEVLKISPPKIKDLFSLDYGYEAFPPDNSVEHTSQKAQELETIYTNWKQCAEDFLFGMEAADYQDTLAVLEEKLSAALCYFIFNLLRKLQGGDSLVNLNEYSRDALYLYLLIDNQVSPEIKSTRIAEAIASIQLYVNRALAGIEGDTVTECRERKFFVDWGRFNKRYSTWAGGSMLAYFPENYVDPATRIGQTKMMDDLLESISQSKINTDVIEDAFMSYLAKFEQVANLEVISAYHDSINTDDGFTYFVGRAPTEKNTYYWRRVDHEKSQNGRFSANAWSEWNKIVCSASPLMNCIRPLIFSSRLYMVWLEQNGKFYELKVSHIRYDGGWSTPVSFSVNSALLDELKIVAVSDAPELGFYATVFSKESVAAMSEDSPEEEVILVFFYKKIKAISKSVPAFGMCIYTDMTSEVISFQDADQYVSDIFHQFDSLGLCHVNYRYSFSYEYRATQSFEGQPFTSSDYLERIVKAKVKTKIVGTLAEAMATFDVSFAIKHKSSDQYSDNYYSFPLDLLEYFYKNNLAKYGDSLVLYHTSIQDDKNNYCTLIYNATRDEFYHYHSNVTPEIIMYKIYLGEDEPTVDPDNLVPHDGKVPLRFQFKDNDLYTAEDKKNVCKLKLLYDRFHTSSYRSSSINQPINTEIPGKFVSVAYSVNEKTIDTYTADKNCHPLPVPSLADDMIYAFDSKTIDIAKQIWSNNSLTVNIDIQAAAVQAHFDAQANVVLESDAKRALTPLMKNPIPITITRKFSSPDYILRIVSDQTSGAQYMEWGPYRERLNTLFAAKLVTFAQKGIDSILSLKVQQLKEPQLGRGCFVNVSFSAVQSGSEIPEYSIFIAQGESLKDYQLSDGVISSQQTTNALLFIPVYTYNKGKEQYHYYLNIYTYYPKIKKEYYAGHFEITTNDGGKTFTIKPQSFRFQGINITINKSLSVPQMDFTGANALYFWELFYYTPMLMAQRLLQEQNFDEADRWLKYIWNPSGYIVHDPDTHRDHLDKRCWNVRPLLEEQSWRDVPLDSYDPDAVCQYDPMHYKLATFMRSLDVIIARGDAAYRKRERDTLNEAKMWYMQASHFLGTYPTISQAADWDQTWKLREAANGKKDNEAPLVPAVKSANTLLDVFNPQMNEALLNYWHVIEQRLFNLRHSLSIDGQPLHLPVYAAPADPKALLTASVLVDRGGAELAKQLDQVPLWRFTVMLDKARAMVSQLINFGTAITSIIERQDAEALAQLLQNQAKALLLSGITQQNKTIEELDKERLTIELQKTGALLRLQSYGALYDENINAGEQRAMQLRTDAAASSLGAQLSRTAGGALNIIPNIYGLADGGGLWGDALVAVADIAQLDAEAKNATAEMITTAEAYRRRWQEWGIQLNNANAEVEQCNAQLATHDVQRQAAALQKKHLEIQQAQTQAQYEFLRNKFSNQNLYSWLRSRLSGVYSQFYDRTISSCMAAQAAYRWESGNEEMHIHLDAWQNIHSGLMCGEILMADLARLEAVYQEWESRALEVERTVPLSQVYASEFTIPETIKEFLSDPKSPTLGRKGSGNNTLELKKQSFPPEGKAYYAMEASFSISDLKIAADYPHYINKKRRVKQISVSLPTLLGPYQNIQAELAYSGGEKNFPRGCSSVAISRGMNDSGLFLLDFNDGRYLPFEGLSLDKDCNFTLSFFNADLQSNILLSLSDIIIHLRYTIRD